MKNVGKSLENMLLIESFKYLPHRVHISLLLFGIPKSNRQGLIILAMSETFLFCCKIGFLKFDLVLDVPLGLLALHAELASEVDLVTGAHLDRPTKKLSCLMLENNLI